MIRAIASPFVVQPSVDMDLTKRTSLLSAFQHSSQQVHRSEIILVGHDAVYTKKRCHYRRKQDAACFITKSIAQHSTAGFQKRTQQETTPNPNLFRRIHLPSIESFQPFQEARCPRASHACKAGPFVTKCSQYSISSE